MNRFIGCRAPDQQDEKGDTNIIAAVLVLGVTTVGGGVLLGVFLFAAARTYRLLERWAG